MKELQPLIAEIGHWLECSSMDAEALGFRAVNNARAVERIRSGTASVKTLNDVLAYVRKAKRRGA